LKESHRQDYSTAGLHKKEKVGHGSLKVRLISEDRGLYAVCRKVLVKQQSVTWDLEVVSSQPERDADLYIWDYETDPQLSGFEKVSHKTNIFVVERDNFAALRERFGNLPLWTILKPVNPALLEGYVADFCSSEANRHSDASDLASLRRDRDDILQALLECNLLLQEMDQSRNGMIVQSFREIRSPLMATLGYCRMLLDQQLGSLNADQQKVVQRMQQSVQRLFRFSTAMLQSALGPEVRLQSRFEVANVEELLERAVAEVMPFADARGLSIQREITTPGQPFCFDNEQLLQVVVNLLDNAVRFTPRGGQITVRALPVFWDRRARNLAEGAPMGDRRLRQNVEPNAYRIEVCDPGLSFRQAAVDKMENAGAADLPGAKGSQPFAYGLAMCQQVLDSHRGRILAETDEVGVFAFELPFKQPTESSVVSAPVIRANREARVEA
jgi:signal transduction histidine kinase